MNIRRALVRSTMALSLLGAALLTGCGNDGGSAAGDGDGGSSEDGGSASNDGGDGGTSGDGALPNCKGKNLSADGVLDFDLEPIHLTGTVTVNGQALPTAIASRGRIVFQEKKSLTALELELGQAGGGAYDVWVAPGDYEIAFLGNDALCKAGVSPMPCNSGAIKHIALSADGVLDLDIPAITVTGDVEVNGQTMGAASADRGHLRFFLDGQAAGFADTFELGRSGAASYRVTLLPGNYHVDFIGNEGLCASASIGAPAPVPCNSGLLKKAALTADGVLDLDVSAVTVTGKVTLATQPLPTAAADRGLLRFILEGEDGGFADSRAFGSSGAVSYSVTLLSGNYRVDFRGNHELCDALAPPAPLPCNSGLLKKTALASSGVLDLDIPSITVTGRVTVNQQVIQAWSGDRGHLRFSLEGEDGGFTDTRAFGSGGDVSYSVTVLPGSYRVGFIGNSVLCSSLTGSAPPPVPCNWGVLKKRSLAATGVLDVDIPAVSLSGNVTFNQKRAPSAAADRGHLLFTLEGEDGGTADTRAFGTSGDVAYKVTLLTGNYRVDFVGNEELCTSHDAPAPVPCNRGVIKKSAFNQSGVFDLDVPSIQLSGKVTLRGEGVPASSKNRGRLRFALVDGGLLSHTRDLGTSGAVSYTTTILPGPYIVFVDGNEELCKQLGVPGFPTCMDQILAGCP